MHPWRSSPTSDQPSASSSTSSSCEAGAARGGAADRVAAGEVGFAVAVDDDLGFVEAGSLDQPRQRLADVVPDVRRATG